MLSYVSLFQLRNMTDKKPARAGKTRPRRSNRLKMGPSFPPGTTLVKAAKLRRRRPYVAIANKTHADGTPKYDRIKY